MEQNENKLIEYVYEFMTYSTNGIKVTADCNYIGFQNRSKFPLFINQQMIVHAYTTVGQTDCIIWLPGGWLEIDRTQYQINFDKADISAASCRCVVIRKIYKDPAKLANFKNRLIK